MTQVTEYDPLVGEVTVDVDPGYVSSFLYGIEFPVEKFEVVDIASANGAPEEVRRVLDGLPRGYYRSYTELFNTINSL